MVRSAIFLLFVAVAIFAASRAGAQVSSSGVNGVVTDPAGAVISGAKVALVNVATNVERDTLSDSTGDYFFTEVPPARYTIIISATGFNRESISAFNVGIAQVVTVNASLKLGSVNQSVTVQATGTEIESSSAQLGTLIDERAVNDLPLDGRNFTQLLDLTPGVTPISTSQNSGGSGTDVVSTSSYSMPSINGANNRGTLYYLDGMNDIQDHYNSYSVPPIIDMVQEFKVNSHNDAQYGGALGGVVNVATKAGTNTLHGTAWEFVRSNSFDANPFFSAPPSYHLNTFGTQFGGPVVVPHLYNGHNKTFFEVGFEGTQYTKAGSTNILIPTAAQLGETTYGTAPSPTAMADFSSASTGVTQSGACVAGATSVVTYPCQLYDPTIGNDALTPYRPAYLGNQVPVSEFNKNALALITAIFPQAPYTIPGIPFTTDNFQITNPTIQKTWNYSGRLDEQVANRDFIFVRYSATAFDQTGPSSVPSLFSFSQIPAQQYGASWLHVFSPTMTMQIVYGRNHSRYNTSTYFTNRNMWQTFGCSTDMCDSFVLGAPLLVTQSVTGGFSGGEVNAPTTNQTDIHEWSGSIMKTIRNHSIQAGGGWSQDTYTSYSLQGSVSYTGASTENFAENPDSPVGITSSQISAQSGFGLLDFLLDYPNSESKRDVYISERPGGVGNAYVQDSWKITPNLTANYGLRYDRGVINPYGTEASVGLQGSIETGDMDFNTGKYIVQQLPPLCSVRGHAPCLPSATLPANVVVAQGGKILHGTKTDFAPRMGLAYRVNDSMSIRGGFGIFYDEWAGRTQMAQNFQGSWPDTGSLQISNTNTPGTPYTSAQNPFSDNVANLPAATPFGSSNVNYMVDPHWKDPYAEEYNVGIEQQFGPNTVMSINYVGSETHRADVGGYYNTGTICDSGCPYASFAARVTAGASGQPYPYAVPQKSWDHSAASASYNALEVSLRRGFRSGLGYLLSYTWSKTLDEGGDGLFGAEGGVPEDPYNPKGSRGPAGYNIPQIFVGNFQYELPIGTGKLFSTGNRVADYIIGNWQTNGIFLARTGQNFNVLAGGDIAETGNGGTYERAVLVGNPYQSGIIPGSPTCTPPAGNPHTKAQWFNPCAFVAPAVGTLSATGRNFLHDQNYWDLDASVFRQFPIREKMRLDIRAEAFNALNHPVLGTPGTTVTSPSSFGVITSTASSNRILQFSGKIIF